MGLFKDLADLAAQKASERERQRNEPTWLDMFRWRCPRCGQLFHVSQAPGPGEEDRWFESHNGVALCQCGYRYGVDPARVYRRCPGCGGLYTYGQRGWVPAVDAHATCDCGHIHTDIRWETAVEPLYFEKARRSGRSLAVERQQSNSAQNFGTSQGSPRRIIQRRIIQTAEGTFAEETIVEF